MPSATFFNLPEEKRRRLIEAAWGEMTSVSFDKVSINRIIQNANISRGSFYQYFTDKTDLLHFLLEQIRDGMGGIVHSQLAVRDGDLFEACLSGYDWVMARQDDQSLHLSHLIRLVQVNPDMDVSLHISLFRGLEEGHSCCEALKEMPFWQNEDITAEDHLELLCAVVGGAVLRSFRCPENTAQIRERLRKQLVILKRGMLDMAKGEQNA